MQPVHIPTFSEILDFGRGRRKLLSPTMLLAGVGGPGAGGPPPPAGFTPASLFGLQAWYYQADVDYAAGTWVDRSGNSRNATEATNYPTLVSSVPAINGRGSAIWDGTNDILKTAGFTLIQPETVVAVIRAITWTASDALFDGSTTDSMEALQRTATPNIGLYAGAHGPQNANLPINCFGILTAIFNNASSYLGINSVLGAAATAGATGAGGISLGAKPDGTAFANVEISEFIVYNNVLGAYDRYKLENLWSAARNAVPATFNPLSISGCQAWFKADAGTSTTTDGAAVSSWSDQSGNGRTASQGTGANQPLYKANFLNGKPALFFDGTNDELDTAAFVVAQPVTLFIVYKPSIIASQRAGVQGGTNGAMLYVSASQYRYYAGGTEITIGAATADVWVIQSGIFNGASSKGNINGAVPVTGNPGTGGFNGLTIGGQSGTNNFQGYIAEVIAYNSALTDSQRQQVEGYLANKYSINAGIRPFDPLSITGCKGWFKAEGGCDVSTDGATVTTWYDRAGGNRHMVGVGTARPILKTGANGINGLSVVRFDGVNDKLAFTPASDFFGLSAATCVVVFKPSAFNTNSGTPSANDQVFGSGGGHFGLVLKSTPVVLAYHFDGNEDATGTQPIAASKPVLATYRHDGTNLKLRIDGITTTQVASGAGTDYSGSMNLGGYSGFLTGDIAEIVFYNTVLSDQDVATVEAYFENTYATGLKAPNDPSLVANLATWYDASQEVGVADNTAMGTITDRSGNTRDATSAGSARPTFQTFEQNGRPCYRYDGTDDYSRTGAFSLNQPTTSFIISKAVATGNYLLDGAAAANTLAILALSATSIRLNAGSNADTTVASNTGYRILVANFNGASSFIEAEGIKGATINPGAGNASGLTICASGAGTPASFGQYDIAEIATFTGTLSDADIRALINYFAQKYNIAV